MPATQFSTPDPYSYLNGFGSYHEYAANHIRMSCI